MLFSHHSHSGQFCSHAENTLEEMVQAAIARKMHVFGLTEHIPRDRIEDLYPEEKQTPEELFSVFDSFYAEAVRLRAKYAGQIKLLIGFETEWIRDESRLIVENLEEKFDFHFFIGSIHHADSVAIDFDKPLYEEARGRAGGTEKHLFETYFDDQFEMLTALEPPVVGHFDLVRLHSDDPAASFRQWPSVWDKICRNLHFIAEYGGLLELNSAALRKGLAEPYPGGEICKEFLQRGGRFTISDDSHGVAQVATHYAGLGEFMRRVGIATVYYLDAPQAVAGEKIGRAEAKAVAVEELEL